MLHRAVLLWLALVALCGCEEHATLRRSIRIDSVRQIWEQPSQLSLHGDGFPPGAHGEATLTGTLFAPGAPPEPHSLRLPCHALSATLAMIDLKAPALADLQEGPFAGSLEVHFSTQQQGTRLAGGIASTLVRLSTGRTPLAAQFALEQRAQRFQRALGIEALERTDRGLVVAALVNGGASQRAGLALGDEIVRLDGAPVQLPVDILSRGAPAQAQLAVRGARDAELRTLRIDLAAAGQRSDWALWLLCCALGASATALLAKSLGVEHWAAPTRKELWLAGLCALSLVGVVMFVLESTAPALRDALRACASGVLLGCLWVYLMRRARRTLRTTRDPALSPFL